MNARRMALTARASACLPSLSSYLRRSGRVGVCFMEETPQTSRNVARIGSLVVGQLAQCVNSSETVRA